VLIDERGKPLAGSPVPRRRRTVPTLLDVQNALRKSLVHRGETAEAVAMLAAHVRRTVSTIYRKHVLTGHHQALAVFPIRAFIRWSKRLHSPQAADIFTRASPPRTAYLR